MARKSFVRALHAYLNLKPPGQNHVSTTVYDMYHNMALQRFHHLNIRKCCVKLVSQVLTHLREQPLIYNIKAGEICD